MKLSPDHILQNCPECGKELRFPFHPGKKLNVSCPICKNKFVFLPKNYTFKYYIKLISILGLILTATFLMGVLPFLIRPDLATKKENAERVISAIASSYENEMDSIASLYKKKISKIKPDKLKANASANYNKIWKDRKIFNPKYALSEREKIQLKMRSLVLDENTPTKDAILQIAKMDAPSNAKIDVYIKNSKYYLDIEFLMSDLTHGEVGSRTKHRSIKSLKKETIDLISKVAHDQFLHDRFSKLSPLHSISVGCKHVVKYDQRGGSQYEKDVTIYKVRIDKSSIKLLENNPYLNNYSISKYFFTEINEFPYLTIESI